MHTPVFDELASALRDPAARLPATLHAQTGASTARRWAVHRNTFAVTLREALAAAFPVTRQLVGHACFDALAREYIAVDPPRSPVLADYGDGFAGYADAFAGALGVPYLPDMMRLERLHACCANAADAAPVPITAFHALLADPSRLAATRVQLHPACGWLRSTHAIGALWHAHPADGPVDEAALAGIDTDLAQDVLVARPACDVAVIVLPPGAIAWLDALRAGEPIGTALANAANAAPSTDARALFGLLVHHGLAVALQPDLETP